MTIADDNENPKPSKKLSKSLDAVTALRAAMESRLAGVNHAAKAAVEPVITPGTKPELKPEPVAADPVPPPELVQEKPAAPAESASPKVDPKPTAAASDTPHTPVTLDPAAWPSVLLRISERSNKLMRDYFERNKNRTPNLPPYDPGRVSEAFMELGQRLLNDPERFAEAQINLLQGYIQIWQATLARMQGLPAARAQRATGKL